LHSQTLLLIKILGTLLSTLGFLLTPSLLRSRGFTHVNILSHKCLDAFLECRTIQILGKCVCIILRTLDPLDVHNFQLLKFPKESLSCINMPGTTTNTPVVC
jgi:hypothetical protein